MIRHIFIGTFKDRISEETKQKELLDMQAMKDKIPGVVAQEVGFSTGWAGQKNQIVMTVDFATKEDFDIYMTHPYHTDYIDKTGTEYFDRTSFVAAQFEYESSGNAAMDNLLTRRSVRKFKPDMVPEKVLNRIIEAGTYAASGYGKQSAIILAITNKEVRDKLSKMNAQVLGADMDPFYGAPIVLVVLADKTIDTYKYDGSLVMANLLNAAHAEGIDSCWIARAKDEFETEKGKEILKSLGIEGDYEGIGHCVLGYADEIPAKAADRKENFVYYIK